MQTFNLVILRFNSKPFANETMYASTKELVDDVASGQIEAEDIERIINIDLELGTSRDITKWVALEVWRIFDAENRYAHHTMRAWLESFKLDCDHLTGETQDLARDFYGR